MTDEENLAQAVMTLTSGKGARIIFDPIGGPLLVKLADAAASGAIIVEYGALSRATTTFPLFAALSKG